MKRILVIEDDADILDLTTYLLTEAGHTVITSLTLTSVAYIKDINPDLVLLDHRLPDGLGDKLCVEIKADESTCNIPVIFVSADNNIKEIAENSCADAFLAKPFDIDELIGMIEVLLQKDLS